METTCDFTPDDLVLSSKHQKIDVELSKNIELNNIPHSEDVKKGDSNPSDMNDNKYTKLDFEAKLIIFIMLITNFFCFANFSILAPIFPPAAREKGMSQSVVGFVIGLYNLAMFLVSPIIGLIITRVGAKFLFVAGALFSASCGILFGCVEYGPPGNAYTALIFLTRGMQAIGSAAFQTASYAIIAHKFPEKVTTYFSLLETCAGLGLMTGPPISGVLYQIGGYILPFLVTGGGLAIAGVVVWIFLKPVTDSCSQKPRSICSFIIQPATFVISMTVFSGSFSLTFLEPTLAGYLTLFNLETYQIGFVFFIIPALYAACGPFIGIIGDKKGYLMSMMIIGTFVSAIGYMFFAPPSFFHIKPTLWLLILANVIVGVFFGTTFVPSFSALIYTAIECGYPDNLDTSGMVSGVILSAYALGGFAGASFSGVLVDQLGFQMSMFIVGLVFLFNFFLLIIFALSKRKHAKGGDIFDRQRAMQTLASRLKYDEI